MTTDVDLDAVALAELGGHLEVHDVAGVVLDDVQHPGAAVDRLGRLEHLVGRGRGEHLARARRVEHAPADEPAVHRLVARAAARDDPDLALHGRVGTDDDVGVVAHPHSVAVRGLDALEGLPDDVVGAVDQLLSSPSR